MATSNQLIKLTNERINSNEKLVSFVEQAKALTIPLFPETVQFTDPGLKFGAAIVSVDTSLDSSGNNRDIYRNESGGYCLHLSKLNEISQQAGIQITDSRILERKVDEKGQVTFIEHQVKGRLRSVDGSIKEDVATGKYDYFRDLQKYSSEKQIRVRRSHAEALAESNAKTRLYNKLNIKLPSSFTLEELKKPFLIPYVIEDKDAMLEGLPKEVQIDIKKQLAMKRLGLMNDIYQQSKQIEQAEYTEVQSNPPASQEVNISKEEENRINAETFLEVPQKERTEKILRLIDLKGFKSPNGKPITVAQIEKSTVEKQVQFIEMLLNLPEQQEEGLPV